VTPLLHERLFAMGRRGLPGLPTTARTRIEQLTELPLILPSGPHGLRALVDKAFVNSRSTPRVVAEIDGLALLMDAVSAGLGATIQPGAATLRLRNVDDVALVQISNAHARRPNLLVSLSDDELSPAALATRVVLTEVARTLVSEGRWIGASFHEA
jgi:LysR family tcuABC transcriptional regulator